MKKSRLCIVEVDKCFLNITKNDMSQYGFLVRRKWAATHKGFPGCRNSRLTNVHKVSEHWTDAWPSTENATTNWTNTFLKLCNLGTDSKSSLRLIGSSWDRTETAPGSIPRLVRNNWGMDPYSSICWVTIHCNILNLNSLACEGSLLLFTMLML